MDVTSHVLSCLKVNILCYILDNLLNKLCFLALKFYLGMHSCDALHAMNFFKNVYQVYHCSTMQSIVEMHPKQSLGTRKINVGNVGEDL
jgi:hypothetical protein